ncbi:glycosyltransferase [Psychrobacter sanguinis]|uniref:glycosyltransferase n=2 Tax=Psychrobacter sanguinis TaxID=861445 RepID=UPI001D15CF0D|nr:glycosyltransferase [Psychrobacter sanguinis]MCC3308768.1 hypothetical protein [Psychrobacter sanguinis]
MKILFFISVLKHGNGGHLYSLLHISNIISKKHDVGVISIGPGDSRNICNNPHHIVHIDFNGLNLLKLKSTIDKTIKDFQPDIFHYFDVASYNVIAPLYPRWATKTVLNKCGGPNPKKENEFPHVHNLVLFSLENQIWFESNSNYRNTVTTLIPNRVAKINTDDKSTDINKPQDAFTFVKIARIGQTYKSSILDSINLLDILYKRNSKLRIKLFIIGVVEDNEVLEDIILNEHVKNGNVVILTEDKYTYNASKMLFLADATISTGRGVMEAASLGLPVLTINSQSHIPVLLTQDTFEQAFKTNFSGRNIFPSLDNNENLSNIENLITNSRFYENISAYMNIVFDKYFNIEKALDKYENLYNSICNDNKKKFQFSPMRTILTLRTFYKKSMVNKNN